MIQLRQAPAKQCIGCGITFNPHNELDHRWRDSRFCSSTCQRRAGTATGNQPVRRMQFPQGLARIDSDR